MLHYTGKLLTKRLIGNPIFVIGPARSGTSILVSSLSRHPQILASAPESPLIPLTASLVYPFAFGSEAEYYANSVYMNMTYLYESLRELAFSSVFGRYYGLRYILREAARSPRSFRQRRRWIAKIIPDHDQFQAVVELFPQARFLFIVRNGCEVVRSRQKFKTKRHHPFEIQCVIWANQVKKYAYLLQMDQVLLLRQEELLADPGQFFTQVLAFLQLPFDNSPGDYARTNIVHPLDQATQQNVDVQQIFSQRPAAHEGWSMEERKTFKQICSPMMELLGYEMPF